VLVLIKKVLVLDIDKPLKMNKNYTKRDFIKTMAIGSAGLLFLQCFKEKKLPEPIENKKGLGNNFEISDNDVLILLRDNAKYEQFRLGYNKRINKFPKIIAVCKTEKGVQYAVNLAKEQGLKIAIKSGGHSFEGFSSNDGGMVINLSLMKQIDWQKDDTVHLQTGCLLHEIYDDFLPRKRIIPAGSCGTVGIGGLALGGGYGLFSRKYGLTCDNLIGLKMVGHDAAIYDSDDHPDLLWACKGGGNGNFGVVVQLRFKTHQAPENLSSYVFKFRHLTADKFVVLIDKWFEIYDKLPLEAFSAFVLNGRTLTVLVTNFLPFSGAFEQQFGDLIVLSDKYSVTKNQQLPTALKRYYGRKDPLFFKNASCGLFKSAEDLKTIYVEIFEKVISNPGIIFQINTLGGNMNSVEFEEKSSYPHRNKNFLGELQAYWNNPKQENRLVTAFAEIQQLIKSNGIRAHYRNYPDINFVDWQHGYYGKNYEKLQEIKSKFDPEDWFQYEQSVAIA
jgi:FAD/FMN-containing dehydrogenase